MGVLHALCNNRETLELQGWVKSFYEKTKAMDAGGKAAALELDEDLDKIHDGVCNLFFLVIISESFCVRTYICCVVLGLE